MNPSETKMPVVFVGHGSPMNALLDTPFSKEWKRIGATLPKPKAILAVSAHWVSDGTKVNEAKKPQQIYDMIGFPDELYAHRYRPEGSPTLAKEIVDRLGKSASATTSWGIDHGVWVVLSWMYPKADIPVVEMSIGRHLSLAGHYELAKKLSFLRNEGVLILLSGNIVHNLSLVSWDMANGYPWADAFDAWVKEKVLIRDDASLFSYRQAGRFAEKAFRTEEHFIPLLYALGASEGDSATVFNDQRTMGALSMTGYYFR